MHIEKVTPARLSFERGEQFEASVELSSPCGSEGWALRTRLLDNYGRGFAAGERAAKSGRSEGRCVVCFQTVAMPQLSQWRTSPP